MKKILYFIFIILLSFVFLNSSSENFTIVNIENTNILEPNLITKLDTPQNVHIDDNFVASWDVVENASYYYVRIWVDNYNYFSGVSVRFNGSYGVLGVIEDGKVKVDLSSQLLNFYKDALKNNSNTGQAVCIQITVTAKADSNSNYIDSSESWPPSNSVYYSPYGSTAVESLSVTPSNPIIGVGRSYSLSASVLPEDIYYTMQWTSSNSNIASIDKIGLLTGVKNGNTTINVKANKKSETVNVSVYDVLNDSVYLSEGELNIAEKIYDTLENIYYKSDTTGTDIEQVDDVLPEIINGATTINTFRVIKNYEKKNLDDYSFLKSKLNEEYADLTPVAMFNANFELYYKDESNIKHHIFNFNTFDSKLYFYVEYDESLPKVPINKNREFVLLRYYDGNLEEIESSVPWWSDHYEIYFYTDKFADFILSYRDVDVLVESIDVDDDKVEIPVGTTETVNLSFTPQNATNVRFSSESGNKSIATVKNNYNNYNGTEGEDIIWNSIDITGVSEGSTIVTVETEDGHFTKEIEVVVKKAPESIQINKTKKNIRIGEQLQLSYSIDPTDAFDEIEWYSDNKGIVTVDQNGLVTGISSGFASVGVCVYSPYYSGPCDYINLEVGIVPVYRMYNPINGEHLYTTDAYEVKVIYETQGWGFEGIGWYSPSEGTPVYRLYNPKLGNHLYTSDLHEIEVITTTQGWVKDFDGAPVMYSGGDIPIFRLFNPGLQGQHHLTTDFNEYNVIPIWGWQQEGISMNAFSKGIPVTTYYYKNSHKPIDFENIWKNY